MTPFLQASPDQPIARAQLGRFSVRLLLLATAVVVPMLIVSAVAADRTLLLSLMLTLWCWGVLVWVRWRADAGAQARAVALAGVVVLCVGLLGVWLVPDALPVAVLMPLVVVALALPYLDDLALRRMCGVALLFTVLAVLAVGLAGAALPQQLAHQISLAIALMPPTALGLLLLYYYRSQFTHLAARQGQIEAEIQARTTHSQQRAARYRAISELISDYVCVVHIGSDGAQTFEWLTETLAGVSGYSLEELQARWADMVHPEDLPQLRRGALLFDTQQPEVREFRIITRAGEVRWLREHTRPEWDAEQGRVAYILSAAQDITERKRAEEQHRALERNLQETQKLESLGVLAGGIAHDFNNFLTTVLGNTGLALRELPPTSEVRESLERIERATMRASELTRQMLAYTGRSQMLVEPLDLNLLVEQMVALFHVSISKSVVLRYQLAPDLPQIEADSSQIRQVVMNLIVNASEAIGEATGSILVSTNLVEATPEFFAEAHLFPEVPAGTYVCLKVSDTGCGIAPETLSKIFDPFFTTKFTGRGLGLAAVQGIVRGHKGALKVQSSPGHGTTFMVLFPCLAAEPSPELQPASALDALPASRPPAAPAAVLPEPTEQDRLPPASGDALPRPRMILVIDDEEPVRTVTARMLRRFGFTALVASDGRMGIEVFRAHAHAIACVILDMTMPQINGEQVYLALRRIKPDVCVLLMSGYDEQGAINRFVGHQVAGFLHKPFTASDLSEKIGQVLEEQPLEPGQDENER